jgi:roundabout axon guidance receptor 2
MFAKLFLIVFNLIILTNSVKSEAPKIEQHPNSIVVNISDPVTLECRASGTPKPIIMWYKDGQPLNIIRSNSNSDLSLSSSNSNNNNKYTLIHDSNLFIFSASLGKGNKSDTGTYYCRAENEHGYAISSNANLIITYLKDDFREVPKSRQVNSGVTVLMECKAPKGQPEPFTWWEKNGAQLKNPKPYISLLNNHHQNSFFIYPNGTLIINNASLIDSGEYVCVARNDAGYRYSPPALLNVFDKPSFTIEPESSKFVQNSRAELRCEAQGYPKPQIEWKKEGSMDNIPLKAQISDNLLVIPNLQIEDEGEYTCMASNQLGTVESKAAFLFVYEKPQFIKPMPNITIGIETKSLTIECNARGKPSPVIYWAKSASSNSDLNNSLMGTSPNNHQDDFIILENGNLFIERLSKKYEGTYLCQASNEHGSIESRTYLQVKPIQLKPPPLVVYWPQNQTIPINTQAILECLASNPSNIVLNEKTNSHPMSHHHLNDKITISWYKNDQKIEIDRNSFDIKYRLHDTGSLEVNSVLKTDSGIYKCVATNSYGQTSSKYAFLNVENPNNQYVEFQRNYEPTALPSAPPTQPLIHKITSRSLELSWQASSHSGHSPIRSYTIEYFSPEWPKYLPGWVILADNVKTTSFLVENLQPDTYYMFIVRARNDQGYGPPSQGSDLVRTAHEPHFLFSNKNSNEILEKALTGEVIHLIEPVDVLSSTSINITWKILKSAYLIEGFLLKFKSIGAREYQTEKLVLNNKNYQNFHVLNNLQKNTMYEFLMEPYAGSIRGSESNIVQARTREDTPSQSPSNLHVDMNSLNSLSIKWQSVPSSHQNGIIQGYKIVSQANETKFNLNLNTNSTTRAIIIANLVENMRYCIKIAAYTKIGQGPYTGSKCVEMTSANLLKSQQKIKDLTLLSETKSSLFTTNNRFMKETWFLVIASLFIVLFSLLIIYLVWYMIRKRMYMKKSSHNKKYLSSLSSSSDSTHNNNNQNSLTHHLNHHNNRYKLVSSVNDPHQIWLDTMHSTNNNFNTENHHNHHQQQQHHKLYLQQQQNGTNFHFVNNPCSSTLERKRMQNLSIKSKYTENNTTLTTTNTNNTNSSLSSSSADSAAAPQYAEIYASMSANGGANPYATTGLFLSQPNNEPNFYNLLNNSTNVKYSSYTINNQQQQLDLQKQHLIKYIQQQSQSQANTPRMNAKQMQNRRGGETVTINNQQQENTNTILRNYIDLHKNVLLTNGSVLIQPPPPPILHQAAPLPPNAISALQQQQLIDEYLVNALQNTNNTNNVQYSVPWNQNDPNNFNSFNNNNNNNINSMNFMRLNNITSSTLARNQQCFTAQQYMNRQLSAINQQQMQQQQQPSDYSTIGNDEEEENNNHQNNDILIINEQKDKPTSSLTSSSSSSSPMDTNSNSTNNSFLSSSKRSSKSDNNQVILQQQQQQSQQQHYANGDDLDDEDDLESEGLIRVRNDDGTPLKSNKSSENEQKMLNEFYNTDLPQTIL